MVERLADILHLKFKIICYLCSSRGSVDFTQRTRVQGLLSPTGVVGGLRNSIRRKLLSCARKVTFHTMSVYCPTFCNEEMQDVKRPLILFYVADICCIVQAAAQDIPVRAVVSVTFLLHCLRHDFYVNFFDIVTCT